MRRNTLMAMVGMMFCLLSSWSTGSIWALSAGDGKDDSCDGQGGVTEVLSD